MSEELIAADIRVAQTLPSRFYHDESLFKSLLSTFNGWQYAIHKSDLSQNSITPIEHIEAITGEPTIIVKGSDAKAMSNICTHRGMRLVSQPCDLEERRLGIEGSGDALADGELASPPVSSDGLLTASDGGHLHEFVVHVEQFAHVLPVLEVEVAAGVECRPHSQCKQCSGHEPDRIG